MKGTARHLASRLGLLASAALAPLTAHAQAAAAATGDTSPQTTVAPPPAAPDIAPPESNGEIIVTAQKRSQNLQQVPIAVTAVGAERLQDAHVQSLEGLQNVVPNVSFGNDFGVAKIFIRGVGMNVSTNGTDSAVAVYVDGAVVSRPEAQFATTFDLQRVEVLRGPQGTLFGRNAVGGAINLITAKPTHDLSGYLNLTGGNYGRFTAEGALSGPLADGLYLRAAFDVDRHDGYGHNTVTGDGIDNLDKKAGRVEFLIDKGGPLTNLLTGEYFVENDNSNAVKFGSATFPTVGALFPLGRGGFATNPRDVGSDVDPRFHLKTWSVTDTLDWKLAPWLSLRNIANYRFVNQQLIQDLDVSSVVNSLATNGQAPTIQNKNPFSRQWSEELQGIVSLPRLEGVVGGFYFHENLGSLPNVQGVAPNAAGEPLDIPALTAAGIAITNPIPSRFAFFNDRETSRAFAFYGDFTYHLADTLFLKAGGRFSHERRTLLDDGYVIGNNGRGPVVFTNYFNEKSFNNFSPRVGIEYHPDNNLMIYYTFSRGFKSGTGEISLSKNPITNPETISSHELGLKSQLFDRKLTFNLALFYNRLHGLQLERTVFNQLLSFTTVYENATETEAYGVELDTSLKVTPEFHIDLAGTYLHSVFKNYSASDPNDPRNIAGSPVFAPFLTDLDGNATRYSPKWTFDLHPEYDWRLATGGQVALSTDVSYKSKQYHTEFNSDALSQPKYVWINANLKYVFPGGHLSVEAFVQNLTNKLEKAGSFSLSSSREIGVTYLPPRTFGGTVGYRF